MPKNKKNFSCNKKKQPSKTIWDHHDNMIVNLRDWVDRLINNFNEDVKNHAPLSLKNSKMLSSLSAAKDLNIKMWDQIRIAHNIAEASGDLK